MKTKLFCCLASALFFATAVARGETSGEYYDWSKTRQPERPWVLPYHQTLVMKIFLAEKQANDGCWNVSGKSYGMLVNLV